ncbi:hypothetical protein [Butyrivibrio proteoclasticus]|uniref:hypothetical protein n=1 Tax=Butyrivibrio proteoclasticus TaxID=43305 RepID=UPI00047B1816|nr:hypothetical protein [Butyrivibrio proteoclasticus]
MDSLEILGKIKGLLQVNKGFVKQIPVEDVVSCVYVEVYGLRQLYSAEHFARLEGRINEYAATITSAKESGDADGVLAILDKLEAIIETIPDQEISQSFIEEANFDKALLRHRSEKTAVVIGDSHVNFFSGNEDLSFIPIGQNVNTCQQVNGLPLTVLHLGPCLAFKSNQYGSTNMFREKLDWLIEEFITEKSRIIVCLGEIDIRAHVFKEVEKQGVSYEEVVDGIVANYFEFLDFLAGKGFEVTCYGPVASQRDSWPTTEDHPRIESEKERNLATKYFNDKCQQLCELKGYSFFTMFYDMVDENMCTREEYMSADMFHLGQFGAEKLKEFCTKICD